MNRIRLLLVAGFCLLALVAPLAAMANQTADLSVTQTDNPDPVAAGGLVTYTVVVANAGPNPANNISVLLTLSNGANFESVSGHRWSCSLTPGTAVCSSTQEGALPAGKTSSNLIAIARAPSDDQTDEFTHTAFVSAAGYAEPADKTGNNTWVETTHISGRSSGTIAPGGGSITTCSASGGTTTTDNTCATLTFPKGPGGEAKLIEGGDLAICTDVGCSGNSVDVIVPEGYDFTVTDPITLELEVDASEFPDGAPDPIDSYVQKSIEGGEITTFVIPSCATPTPGLPCQDSQFLDEDGDLHVIFKLFSGDPIFELGDGIVG